MLIIWADNLLFCVDTIQALPSANTRGWSMVENMLQMWPNKKLLQVELTRDIGKCVTVKDIHNTQTTLAPTRKYVMTLPFSMLCIWFECNSCPGGQCKTGDFCNGTIQMHGLFSK